MSERIYVDNPDKLEVIKCSCGDEIETTICLERNSKIASIYTSDNAMVNKLKKQWLKNPEWKCWEGSRDSDGAITGYFFETPKKAICIRTGLGKQLSDEAKEAFKERARKYREGKKNEQN